MKLTEKQLTARADKYNKSWNGKTFKENQELAKQMIINKNEWLTGIENILAKQVIMDTLKTRVAFIKWFWKEGMAYGDLIQFRQNLMAKVSAYDELLDPNDHYKLDQVVQYAQTLYRDRYELAISVDIIQAAFLGAPQFNNFIDNYMEGVVKSLELKWLDRFMGMFEYIPVIVKCQKDLTGRDYAMFISKLILKAQQVDTHFNIEGLPTRLDPNATYVVQNVKDHVEMAYSSYQGSIYLGDNKQGTAITEAIPYDFRDGYTRCVIMDGMTYYLDKRLDKNTLQEWAKTLIGDKYLHQWIRVMMNEWVVAIRVVNDDYPLKDGDLMDYKKSPFTIYAYDGNNKKILAKHEIKVKDITEYVMGEKYINPLPPTYVMNDILTLDLGEVADNNEATIHDKFLVINELFKEKINGDNTFHLENITETKADLVCDRYYVVNSYTNRIKIMFTIKPAEGK